MKATEAKLLDFLKKSPQFVIPIYQRTYSWTQKECRQLWDDLIRAGKDKLVSAHFVGSIVYIEQGLYQVTTQSPMLVIDGQQRLTTLTLIISALANALEQLQEGGREVVEGFSAKKLRNYYLRNPDEDGERFYKLLLTQTDKASLISIVDQSPQPEARSLRVTENFDFFTSLIVACEGDLEPVCNGLAKLVVVDIALSRDQDNPQLIFESMNSTGRKLSQADLIRNFILMGLSPDLQTKLYERFWRPMELEFGQDAYATHFDSFVRHFLTLKTGEIPNILDVYEKFKVYALPHLKDSGVQPLVIELRNYARYFCALALGSESNSELSRAFQDLRELRVDVAYPFLLELYADYAADDLSSEDFLAAVRLVESYVFRRAICGIPTNSLNKTFANFTKALRKDRYLESIQAHLLLMPSYRGLPTNEEFKREIQTRDLYKFPRKSYWLRRLENFNRKEPVPVDEYTIEHILPQNERLSSAWKTALGEEWKRVRETWLHTLGNLTLTGYNSEYSDHSFQEKRDMPGGFAESPLRLNKGLGQLTEWNEDEIKARAQRLANTATRVWIYPALSDDILSQYKSEPTPSAYTLADHPYLTTGITQQLFEAFRREVLALDTCVSEEFLKLYVAYKAETNFVDVVPQARRLLLSLNLPFSEIVDPRGLCKDVSNKGRWGNGDVEVGLSSLAELPYCLGLIRQSLEKQMGAPTDT